MYIGLICSQLSANAICFCCCLFYLVDWVVALALSHGSIEKTKENRLAPHFEQPLESSDCQILLFKGTFTIVLMLCWSQMSWLSYDTCKYPLTLAIFASTFKGRNEVFCSNCASHFYLLSFPCNLYVCLICSGLPSAAPHTRVDSALQRCGRQATTATQSSV